MKKFFNSIIFFLVVSIGITSLTMFMPSRSLSVDAVSTASVKPTKKPKPPKPTPVPTPVPNYYAPRVEPIKTTSTKIKGKAKSQATVYIKFASKNGVVKANNKGYFTYRLSKKLSKGTKVTVWFKLDGRSSNKKILKVK